ncbi:hypothetical protein K6119_00840 [Paracrocinitomix mangrovi]|uniref:hypothetical protein n=1 Tax=Paracrocinitomix mangrovi TaxID=2862509 RepID=UPI001C8E7BE5|nr:hypothetical protein [Paracrocinitomix mangrovi]UKN02060.1 hypothetical protein K6119_00840 [Paracrocinitomix mangrovi]
MNKIYLFSLTILLLTSCKKEDNTPSWLIVNDFTLTTDEGTQGANTHAITDAWIYLDNEALGVWSLPAKIPVLDEGEHTLLVYPGIKMNGISATRTRYPFYNKFETTVNLVKDTEVSVTPTTTYKSNLQFQFIEDFEQVGVQFDKDAVSDTNIVIVTSSQQPDIVKYGNGCGAIYLSETDSVFKAQTNTNLNLPVGEDVYVEIDYMNTNSIALNVIAENSTGIAEHPPVFIINPQDESEMKWKKIYINLIDDVSYEINATSFELYLISILDKDITSGVIYLDNIKVIRYQ